MTLEDDIKQISKQLRAMGLSEDEVLLRLDRYRLSHSAVGSKTYNAFTDSFDRLRDDGLPPLLSFEENKVAEQIEAEKQLAIRRVESMKSCLPVEMYGDLAIRVVRAMSEAYIVNPDVIAASALVVVAEAVNRKATIRHGNYINRPSIWLCLVERTGGNKSEPMARMLKPLESINRDLIEQSARAFAEWKSNGEEGNPPPQLKIIISDSTPEIRNQYLKVMGLLLYRDEVAGFFQDLGRYNASGEIETLLSIWSGKNYSIDRKCSPCFYVENPFLCVIGGIQPALIKSAFGGKNFEGSGFLARWLFLWVTDSIVPDSLNEELICKEIENDWYNLIQDLWRMQPKEYRLSQGAAKVYQAYMKSTADFMNAKDCEDSIRGMMAKMRIYALRIALIIHLLRFGKNASVEVDEFSMEASIRTCKAFERWNNMTLEALADKEAAIKISNADLLQELVRRYHVDNQSELARVLNTSQQNVSKLLKSKHEK